MDVITVASSGSPVSLPSGSINLQVRDAGKSQPELLVSEKRVAVAENATSLNPIFAPDEPKVATTKIAVHCSRKFAAYVQGGVPESGVAHGCRTVLVTDWQRNLGAINARVAVADLAFAYDIKDVVLAVVDVFGDVLVVNVTSEGRVQALVNVQVEARGSIATHHHMVRWCPYVPGPDDLDYLETSDPVKQRYSRLLLVTNNAHAEVWSIDKLQEIAEKIDGHKLNLSQLTCGRTQTESLPTSQPIVDAAVALDGSSFATLHGDGSLCFWEFDEPLIEGKAPARRKTIPPVEDESSLKADEVGFNFIYFPDDLSPRKGTDDEMFWMTMVVGTGKTIRVFNMENWSVVQKITIDPSAWQVSKDPLGKCLLLASQQHNQVLFFSVDSQDEDQGSTLSTVTAMQSPRIFQYADIVFRSGGGSKKGYDEVKRVRFAGFSNTGIRLCELVHVHPKASAPTTPSAAQRSHSPKDIVIVRKARLDTDDTATSERASLTPVAPRRKDIAMPNPIKVKTPPVAADADPVPSAEVLNPEQKKAPKPPKCEMRLTSLRAHGRSAFSPVKSQPPKSLAQIEKELAAQLESPTPPEEKTATPTPASEESVTEPQRQKEDAAPIVTKVEDPVVPNKSLRRQVEDEMQEHGSAPAAKTTKVSSHKKSEEEAGVPQDSPDSTNTSRAEKQVLKPGSPRVTEDHWEIARFNVPGRNTPLVVRYPRNAKPVGPVGSPSDVPLPADTTDAVQEGRVSSSFTEEKDRGGSTSSSSGAVSMKTHAALAVSCAAAAAVDVDDKASTCSASTAPTADVQEMIKVATKTAVDEMNKNFKMDQIKMNHSVAKTIKSEFAKMMTEEGGGGGGDVSQRQGGRRRTMGGGEGDGAASMQSGAAQFREFTRVHEILATVQDQIRTGQYDKAWMNVIGKKVDDLLLLDIRDMIAKAKQQDR